MDYSSGGFIDGGGGGQGCAPLLALVNRGEGVQNITEIYLTFKRHFFSMSRICDEKCFLYLDHSIS